MNQVTEKQIFTIGHGNRNIEKFISLINQYQIEVVVDVRTLPYSRFHSQFRQANLKASLENARIKYVFLGNELGGRPTNPELYEQGELSYSRIKETELYKSGIQKVLDLVNQNIKVTLMCSESNPNECHRKHLIEDDLIKLGIKVFHIDKVGSIENCNPQLFA